MSSYVELVVGIFAIRQNGIGNLFCSIGELSVESSFKHQHFIIGLQDFISKITTDEYKMLHMQTAFRQLNRMFILSMWEILVGHNRYNDICNEEEIQFFRHIRNGCAHDNKLNFKQLEKTAKWRTVELKSSDIARSIFPDVLKDGDPILLLIDINNKYFTPINFYK
ncbi:TPA: hypothetical protein DF272_05790 [Candidatus Falkowbacteria bacterium]|nr:hypothetical protein [Candidatus Falkowbacteria bacterium]